MKKPNRSKKVMQNSKSTGQGEHGLLADLPACLQHEILTRLPLKTLFTLKSVSKRWNSIISASDFSESYIVANKPVSPNRTLLLRCSNRDPVDERKLLLLPFNHDESLPFTRLYLPFPFSKLQRNQIRDDEPYIVVTSSNGLLLCSTQYENKTCYGICNPITRQWIVLPRREGCYDHDKVAFVAKVDKLSSIVISFRVACLVVDESCSGFSVLHMGFSVLHMEIYDSDTKKWTKTEVKVLPGRDHYYITIKGSQPAYLNESAHWEVQLGNVHYAVAVDPYKRGEDQCGLMVLPTTPILSRFTTDDTLLGVCNGKLQYLRINEETDDIAIWVLEDYAEENWVLKHMLTSVDLSYRGQLGGYDVFRTLAFHPLDSGIIYMCCAYNERFTTMIVFDIEKETLIPSSSTIVRSCYVHVFPFDLPLWPPIFDCPYVMTNPY